jgi:hypothetical protein
MKIIGAILLALGLFSAFKAFTVPDKKAGQGSEAYQQGRKIGRITAPTALIGIGLGLLLRRSGGPAPRVATRPVRAGFPPAPVRPPPVVPLSIPVKIACSCGQNYAFEVEPVGGRMPAPVVCPVCGADGTDAANATIAQTLAARLQSQAVPAAAVAPRRRVWPMVLVGAGAVVLVFCLLVAASVVRTFMRVRGQSDSRPKQIGRPYPDSAPPSSVRPDSSNPRPTGAGRNLPAASKPGTAADAAPVPATMTEVDVFWGGRWWPATIVKREGQRAFIHYDGWASSHDEWVTPDRLRPRRK